MRMLNEHGPAVRLAILVSGALLIGLAAQIAAWSTGGVCDIQPGACALGMAW